MSNYATLKSAIQSAVYTNGNGEITGAGLQAVLLQIVNTVGDGYVFKGVATGGTSPGTPDENVYYIAPAGVYNNFGSEYVVQAGELGVFTYNGTWSKNKIQLSEYQKFTDNDNANRLFKAMLLDPSITNIRITVGTANNIRIGFRDGNGELKYFYFANIAAITAYEKFYLADLPNIVAFDVDTITEILTNNYGKSNYYIDANVNSLTYDNCFFYLNYRMDNEKYITADGMHLTDNRLINVFLPKGVVTSGVKKLHVTAANYGVRIYLRDENNADISNKYFNLNTIDSEIVEVVTGSTTSLEDGLFIINKNAVKDYLEMVGLPSAGYIAIDGNVNAAAYSYKGAELYFGDVRTRDWGTGSVDIRTDGSYAGSNIYNVVDCFRFPCVIDSITIPSNKDTVVEIYRTRLDDVSGVDSAVLLDTISVKKGKYEYPCNIYMEAGEGIGMACASASSIKFYDSGWRLASYNIETLLRTSVPTGFANGAMVCSVKYRYFAEKQIKPLSGLTLSVIGDSISTFGVGYSYSNPYYPSGNVLNYMRTWWGKLVEDGVTIVKNMSVSQSTVVNRTGDDEHRWIGYAPRIEGLADDDDVAPDVIIVLAGINDMYNTSDIGSFDFSKNTADYGTLDTFKFSTAYQWVVMKLLELYPTSKIYLGTPFKAGVSAWGFPEVNGSRYLMQICAAIKELAASLGVGCIDFYSETKISWSQMNSGAYGDKTHPNLEGHYQYYKIARRHLIDYVQKDNRK